MVKVAVLGYGTVGSGIVEVIKTNQDMVNKKAGDEIDVKYILDLRDFPGDPVLPGVYTVEIMAQTSDILILSTERYAGKVPLFIGINNVKFKSPIRPGDTLEIHSEMTYEKEEKAIVTCSAEVYDDGVLACTGDVTLAMR